MSKNKEKQKSEDNQPEPENTFDDMVFESEEDQTSASNLKKLREKLKQISAEKQDYLEGWQRSKADFINLKRDFEEEKIKLVKSAKADLIVQLIPVLDSFEMALRNDREETNNLLKDWMVGMKHIYLQLLNVLKDNGVEPLDCLGDKFNPELHSSLENVSVNKKDKENTVVEVVQKGYTFKGQVLRPAKVKVGKLTKKAKI